MKALLLMICLFSLNVYAREFKRVEGSCNISGFQEDIDTPKFRLPKSVELHYNYTYAADTLEVVRRGFSMTPDSTSKIPLLSSLKDNLLFDVDVKSVSVHFSSILSREGIINLIQHLASDDTLQLQDPLELPSELAPPFTQFLLPEGYFFNFVYGLTFQAHLPLSIKNGLSYHIRVSECGVVGRNTSFAFKRPGSKDIVSSSDLISGPTVESACSNSMSLAMARLNANGCSAKISPIVLFQKPESSPFTDTGNKAYSCLSILRCQ